MGCGASSQPAEHDKQPNKTPEATPSASAKPAAAASATPAAAEAVAPASKNATVGQTLDTLAWAKHPLVAGVIPRYRPPSPQWFVDRTAGMDGKLAAFDSTMKKLVDSCSTGAGGITEAAALTSALDAIRTARAAAIGELAGGLDKLQLCEALLAACGQACGSAGAVSLLPFSRLTDQNTSSLALLDAGLEASQLMEPDELQKQMLETCASTRRMDAIGNARALVYSLEASEDEAAAAVAPLEQTKATLDKALWKLTTDAIGAVKPDQLGVLSRWGWGEVLAVASGHQVLLNSRAQLSATGVGRQMPRRHPLNAVQLVQVKVLLKLEKLTAEQRSSIQMSSSEQEEFVKVLSHVQALEVACTKLRLIASWNPPEAVTPAAERVEKISGLLQSKQAEARAHLQTVEGDHEAQLKAIEFVRLAELEITSGAA